MFLQRTARAGAVVPILLGMIAAFKVSKESKLASLLIITTVQVVSIWNIGIKQVAQNIVATNFINQNLGHDVSWGEWFLYAHHGLSLCQSRYSLS